jgi:DNA topoisomerase-1
MAKNLVIVESPAKAKTIEKYLGKDFTVKSSYGHIRDLASKNISVDVENNFEPIYEISSDKKKLVKELKGLADKAETIWLATDEDREGEAISWHLKEALGLTDGKTKRITFNEITKPAILKAIDSPRAIDSQLVDAQQARRILDRLVGFELSPVLWKKVKPSLSAGRVQSVAVRLIVEREKEIQNFTAESSYRVVAIFETPEGKAFRSVLNSRIKTEKEAKEFLEICKQANFKVNKIDKKPAKRSPASPFTTSTLQQEASRKLGFSVSRTMSVAQKLYESGRITYMRTDSVNLSDTAMGAIQSEIVKSYGEDYSNPRKFVTKSKGAQEAHEAIRPTNFADHSIDSESAESRLYELIWKRTVASQMSDALLEKSTLHVDTPKDKLKFQTKGELVKFDGFLKLYIEGNDDENVEEEGGVLPNVAEGDALTYKKIEATERFTHHPPRYTEASLVKKLEELGIGRPSTYAPTISTVQKRSYVEKPEREGKERKYQNLVMEGSEIKSETLSEITGAEKSKLAPTDIGIVVTDFLVENFGKILDYGFTASVEKEFDDIAQGLKNWTEMIRSFYNPFHESVEDTLENSERAKGERLLGEDPKSGKNVYARIGRFGPMIQIGEQEDEEKPKFASLRKNQSIQTISLEEALELFKLPRTLGEFEGQEVSAAIGRFGPYVRHGKMFVSLKEIDPLDVTLEQAVELIKEKIEADKNKYINTFDNDGTEIQVLNGRYGPYIKVGRKNYKIPKDKVAEELSMEDCIEIINAAPAKKGKKK